jgi:hypothetical protein
MRRFYPYLSVHYLPVGFAFDLGTACVLQAFRPEVSNQLLATTPLRCRARLQLRHSKRMLLFRLLSGLAAPERS